MQVIVVSRARTEVLQTSPRTGVRVPVNMVSRFRRRTTAGCSRTSQIPTLVTTKVCCLTDSMERYTRLTLHTASDKTGSDVGNDSSLLSVDEGSCMRFYFSTPLTDLLALLPPPFMSYHRRSVSASARPRALSASMPENQAPAASPSPFASRRANVTMPLAASPVRARRPANAVSNNLMSTPPPNRALSTELKLKGSLTEPTQPRRREPFGSVCFAFSSLFFRND